MTRMASWPASCTAKNLQPLFFLRYLRKWLSHSRLLLAQSEFAVTLPASVDCFEHSARPPKVTRLPNELPYPQLHQTASLTLEPGRSNVEGPRGSFGMAPRKLARPSPCMPPAWTEALTHFLHGNHSTYNLCTRSCFILFGFPSDYAIIRWLLSDMTKKRIGHKVTMMMMTLTSSISVECGDLVNHADAETCLAFPMACFSLSKVGCFFFPRKVM
jgi:hypothetical protein